MKARQFFQGLSWLLLLNVLIKPVWIFLIDREVQNAVGHQLYGSYFALFNLSYVLLFLADAGLTNMMVQQLAGTKTVDIKRLVNIKLTLLVGYVILCCFVGRLSGIEEWNIFLYLIFLQAAGSLLLFLRGLLAAHQLYKTNAYFSVADKTLVILFCSPFLYGWWQPISLVIFLQIQLGSIAVVTVFLSYILFQKKLISSGYAEKTVDIIKRIIPFATIILLMGMHYRLDGFLLERIRPDGALQAGFYAMAYRLTDAANMIGYLTASFLVPFIARNKENYSLVNGVTKGLEQLLILTGIAVSCFAFVFASWIQQVLYGTTSSFNTQVIQLCIAVLPAYYLTHIYGSVLTATNNFRTFILILTASVLLNIVLNLFFIPSKGALGSCIAALASQYSCALCCYYVVTKKFQFDYRIRTWLIYIGSAIVFLILLFFLQSLIQSVWIILAVIGLLIFSMGLTQLKRIKQLIQSISY